MNKFIIAIVLVLLFSIAHFTLPAQVEGSAHDADAYAQHIEELKKKAPVSFTIVIEKPFVIIGDEAPQVVRSRAELTVRWAVKKLKYMYFTKDPGNIIDIWLFKDRDSYLKYTWEIFGDRPDTPFGYSSPKHKALIMNIATGGGTLVHEIVHPFMAVNFPNCPAWFNEGLGSLYEQSRGSGEQVVGLTNWRLPGLQEAIRGNRVPSFMKLISSTDYSFYRQDAGLNYAQARYLCYYLQEKGVLVDFYHTFRANCRKDPTGLETLKQVLGIRNMTAFKKEWENFVLKLSF